MKIDQDFKPVTYKVHNNDVTERSLETLFSWLVPSISLNGSDADADSAPNSKTEIASPRPDETVAGGGVAAAGVAATVPAADDKRDTKGGDNAATMDDAVAAKKPKKKKVVKKKVKKKKQEEQHVSGMGFTSNSILIRCF